MNKRTCLDQSLLVMVQLCGHIILFECKGPLLPEPYLQWISAVLMPVNDFSLAYVLKNELIISSNLSNSGCCLFQLLTPSLESKNSTVTCIRSGLPNKKPVEISKGAGKILCPKSRCPLGLWQNLFSQGDAKRIACRWSRSNLYRCMGR